MLGAVSNGRAARGRGRVPIDLLPYPIDLALAALEGTETLILVGPPEPVAFFAYPGKPGRLAPEGCRVVALGSIGEDLIGALAAVASRLGALPLAAQGRDILPPVPAPGPLTDDAVAAIVARALPDQAIVCEESITSARMFWDMSKASAPHDYLQLTGGAIGIGIPLSVGAAVACPDRRVVCLQADGSGMYTCQGLWTQAREALDIITIIFANRSYAVLHGEMRQVGVTAPGPNARRMLDLDRPAIDWVSLAAGMGVAGRRADTVEAFEEAFATALAARGPFLIEAVL